MNIRSIIITAVALGAFSTAPVVAGEIVGGPKGGRLLETEPLKSEFFVTDDRKAEIIFYDSALKPVAPDMQTVNVIAETESGRTPLEMEPTSTGFVSKSALPPGDPYRVVVQVRPSADARPKNFRIELELHECAECSRAEYACTCGH